MEPKQIETQLSWLDEQRRKDNESINRLSEQILTTEERLASQAKQLQDLSSEIARLAGLTTRIHQMDETLGKQRQDFSRQLGEAEDRRTEKEKALEEIRKSDLLTLAKQLEELRSEIEVMDEFQQALNDRREAEILITSKIDILEKTIEDLDAKLEAHTRSQVSLEEGRKQDSRRLGELQTETSEILKRIETMRGEHDSTEDRVRRIEVRVTDLVASENERREAQTVILDQQNLKLAGFERNWQEWEQRLALFEKRAADLDERMLAYEEIYRSLKQMQRELDEVVDRLERRINEVTEMQRLADDRMKQEWSSFQADDQKRWNTYKLTADEGWREHDRLHDKLVPQIQLLEENVTDILHALAEIRETDQQRILEIHHLLRDWATEIERRARSGG
jgi:chromosome segregation ATPase